MLEANLLRFRQMVPDIRFTVLSRDPAWTGRHYDVESLAIPPGILQNRGVEAIARRRGIEQPARIVRLGNIRWWQPLFDLAGQNS